METKSESMHEMEKTKFKNGRWQNRNMICNYFLLANDPNKCNSFLLDNNPNKVNS